MMRKMILSLTLALAATCVAAVPAIADCITLDYVDIGDPASEAGHAMAGWGPIEPATSGGHFGLIDDCRPVYAPEDGDVWATIDLDFGDDPTTCKTFTVHHLDGHTEDTFDLYIDGVLMYTYLGDGLTTEHWYTLDLDVCLTGVRTVKFVSTAPQWESWDIYGQMCFDILMVEECPAGYTTLDLVDIGDPTSETGHGLTGWGPIEPATSGGNYGGVDDCRPVYAPEDADEAATLTLDFGDDELTAKCLTLNHLEGIGDDSFDLYIQPLGEPTKNRLLYSYPGDAQTVEHWMETALRVDAVGLQTLTIVSTAPQWSGWATYGQMCFDVIRVDAGPPLDLSVDIGDPVSEADFVMAGWGPIEPATSGGNYGGIDDCRPVYAPEDGDDWATIDFDLGCCLGPRCLSLRHLDGIGEDAFDVFMYPVGHPEASALIYTYPGDGLSQEVWVTSQVLFTAAGPQTFRIVSTEPQWSGWATYGQMCFDTISVSDYLPVMDAVVVGDPASEAGHAMTGWGPIEPATSGGNYGGIDQCRAVYAPEDNDVMATVELDFGGCADGQKCLVLNHLDGIAVDSFDLYVYAPGQSRPATPFWSYTGDPATAEVWYRTALAVDFDGVQVLEFVSTEPVWDMWDIYGQICLGRIAVEAGTPQDPTPYVYAAVDVDPAAVPVPGRFTSIAPNPFNPATRISFTLDVPARTELAIFDLRGHRVVTLLDEPLAADVYTVSWHGFDAAGERAASGVYFARLRIGATYQEVEKVSMIK